jgi:hypothetical protein
LASKARDSAQVEDIMYEGGGSHRRRLPTPQHSFVSRKATCLSADAVHGLCFGGQHARRSCYCEMVACCSDKGRGEVPEAITNTPANCRLSTTAGWPCPKCHEYWHQGLTCTACFVSTPLFATATVGVVARSTHGCVKFGEATNRCANPCLHAALKAIMMCEMPSAIT